MTTPVSRRRKFRLADKYHMIMLASQAPRNPPDKSHTFALFVREVPQRSGSSSAFKGDRIISWLPEALPIEPFGNPVTGKDYSVAATLSWALEIGRVWAWGAYQIKQELYEKASRRADQLASGGVKYVMIDDAFGSRPNHATNCIHAASDLEITPYLLLTGMKWGIRGSLAVLRYYRRNRLILDPLVTDPAVATHFGLDDYPITWKHLD
jgi:hypothetical protein